MEFRFEGLLEVPDWEIFTVLGDDFAEQIQDVLSAVLETYGTPINVQVTR